MKAKNKHIVILTPGFPKNEADTTCIPALQIYVKALRDISGYDITVVAVHKPFKKTVYVWNEIPVYALGSSSFISKIQLWNKVLQTLKQIHLENPVTVLHSFWLGECALLGHWFAKKNHIKHVTTLMGQDALKRNGYTRILPIKKMRLITLSNFQEQIFYKNYNVKTTIIPWGIKPESFPHSTKKNIDIIGIGYLNKLKNYRLFIDVVYQINQKTPIKSVLIGEGILKEKLQKKILKLQLGKVIELKGEISNEETLQYLSQSKILLHTSNYESFGLVFAEALQSKTRIVSKNIGCAFTNPNWAICKDTEMVAACKNWLSKSFDVTEKNPFTIEKTLKRYLKVYNE